MDALAKAASEGVAGRVKPVEPEYLGLLQRISASLAGQVLDRIANRCGGLLDLVLEVASRIHQMGLHLFCISFRLHLLITADVTSGGLQATFRIFGCGLDLVFEAHDGWAMGWKQGVASGHPLLET